MDKIENPDPKSEMSAEEEAAEINEAEENLLRNLEKDKPVSGT